MVPKVEYARIPVDRRSMQPYEDFHEVAGAEFEIIEQSAEVGIIEEFGQPGTPTLRHRIDAFDCQVEVNTKATPLRWSAERAPHANGRFTGMRRYRLLQRR
jgi:hypothetical protein